MDNDFETTAAQEDAERELNEIDERLGSLYSATAKEEVRLLMCILAAVLVVGVLAWVL